MTRSFEPTTSLFPIVYVYSMMSVLDTFRIQIPRPAVFLFISQRRNPCAIAARPPDSEPLGSVAPDTIGSLAPELLELVVPVALIGCAMDKRRNFSRKLDACNGDDPLNCNACDYTRFIVAHPLRPCSGPCHGRTPAFGRIDISFRNPQPADVSPHSLGTKVRPSIINDNPR